MRREIKIEGARELNEALRKLSEESQRRVIRNSMSAVARIVQREVRRAAPRGKGAAHPRYGRLQQNIRVTPLPSAQRFAVVVHTGNAFWARWVEYGRSKVVVKRKKVLSNGKVVFGREVKAMPPRPFFRPAWDTISPRLLPYLAQRIGKGIEQEASRLARRKR
jgi:HK97 gp10 family phage protein